MSIRDIPRLGVLLPSSGRLGGEQLIAFPLALPMGWVESPPYFTAVTETACDLANAAIQHSDHMPRHRLEEAAHTAPPTHTHTPQVRRLQPSPGDVAHPLVVRPAWIRGRLRMHISVLLPAHRPVAVADVYVDDFYLPPKPSDNKLGCYGPPYTPSTPSSAPWRLATRVIARSLPP